MITRRRLAAAACAGTILLVALTAAPLFAGEPAALRLVIWANDPSDELKLAAEAVGLPIEWRAAERSDLVVAGISPVRGAAAFTALQFRDDFESHGYRAMQLATGDLALIAHSESALANGLYDLRRQLLVSDAEKVQPQDLIRMGDYAPRFAHRSTYQFLAPWNLPNLNGAALTLEQWKAHLERMRRLNVNQFYFDLWADQLYHPGHPETLANKALYDRMREVCDAAHRLGIRTGMFVFPCQVPTSVFLAHPAARAVEAINYRGIHLCPSRAWDATNQFNTYAIEYFGGSLDDVVVEMQDPGSCLCPDCCRQFPELVLKFIDGYRKIPGGPAGRRIDLCSLHFRDWLEAPEIESRVAAPIKDLRQRVFEKLPAGTLLFDSDRATLELGRRFKLKPIYFFFELDPESGLENQQVFPHVKLDAIDRQVRESVECGDEGIMAYRMMPQTQYVADYYLFRKLWNPNLAANPTMEMLAGELEIPPARRADFAQAMRDLDVWDARSDLDSLHQAQRLLAELAAGRERGGFLVDLGDLVTVETALGDFWSRKSESIARPDFYPPPELVEQVYRLMVDRPIFSAYTAHQHWELRSREIVGQRLRWWLQAIRPVGPADQPGPRSP